MMMNLTRKSSCVNARGIPTTAYEVLHMLSYPAGRGVGTLDRGRGRYLGWGDRYLGWGVVTLDRGRYLGRGWG